MTSTPSIVRLKITLDDVEPIVLRRIVVPFNIRMDRLHTIMQASMGWTNSHLWEFRARDTGWGPRDPDGEYSDGPLDASKATLLSIVEDIGTKTLKYLYDFGDGWEHTIKLEKIFDGVEGMAVPFLLDAKGRCPLEDIGGPPGYAAFLEAITDPAHVRHAEFAEFYDANFDPNKVDVKYIEADLEKLAKRFTPKPRKAKPVKTP